MDKLTFKKVKITTGEIKWFVKNGDYIRKGDKIGVYTRSKRDKEEKPLISYFKGTIIIRSELASYSIWGSSTNFAVITKDKSELIEYELANHNLSLKYIIEADKLSENVLKWMDPKYAIFYRNELVFVNLEDKVILGLTLKEGVSYLSVMINPIYIDLQENDIIVFILANEEKQIFSIQGKPLSCDFNKTHINFNIKLFKEDFDILCKSDIVAIRIIATKSTTPFDIRQLHYSHCFFTTFIKACQELSSNWNPDSKDVEVFDLKPDTSCSVYLIKILQMDFIKIGISNKPNFREHTLLSKKPTIKMICYHQYPTLIIAKAKESSLHSAYV